MALTRDDILTYLQEVAEKLPDTITEDIYIFVIGGARELLVREEQGHRTVTEDVDVFLLGHATISYTIEKLKEIDPVSLAVKRAVHAVAGAHHMKREWFNDVASTLIDNALKPKFQEFARFGKLVIVVPTDRCALALKLLAAREKDTDDILALIEDTGIKTYDEAHDLMDEFFPDPNTKRVYPYEDNLEEFFPEW